MLKKIKKILVTLAVIAVVLTMFVVMDAGLMALMEAKGYFETTKIALGLGCVLAYFVF